MKIGLCECFVVNDSINESILEVDESFQFVDLYWSYQTDAYHTSNYIGRFEKKLFQFERIDDLNRRVYYHLKFHDNQEVVMGERILKIPGMYNFRDMGGYPTKDGRRVKWGLIYRGDQLYNLEGDLNYLNSLNIKNIIDFRSTKEIEQYPNRVPNTVDHSYNFSPEAEIAMFAGKLQNNEIHEEGKQLIKIAQEALAKDPNAGIRNMMDQQVKFVTEPTAIESFKNTTKVVLNSDHAPIFQHCKGGKDRTGFASLIQLALLGVADQYLIYDYMLTQKARSEKNKRYYNNFLNQTGDPQYADYFFALFDTKEVYIQAALDAIHKTHDSIMDYAKEIYDITDEEIAEFRNDYLE